MSTQSKGQDTAPASTQQAHQNHKSHELLTCSIKAPLYSYAHLEVARDEPGTTSTDALQFHSFCTSALTQFLGATGAAISMDILKVQGNECWLRVPRQDLGAFAAALTAWPGTRDAGAHTILRIRQCSDWLGAMVGGDGQDKLWTS
ncbi:hypothetical protein BN1723_001314 [Verticillium longisporum]|uniref:Ribonucleases P/MRP subunit Pop8-like domain-containing protein n=2 Tax=Verticillium TaxID=1036719 RepID=G2XDY0_VERDV|nr:uncharacterized protein VDAG_08362 [Verticillium dahliae VdLs.17]KAF3346730.1 E3 ubiquitin-protein ligase RBBP6 [Verticillium dahliae VDG2]KAF3356534.1 O-acetylhomoserine (thiol)-lyase [Verticillium dahliae VDG1]KAG7103626.1 hypothetical protein HYQ44_017714 [Verticillium longisporum]KAH6698766.1 hypothetical protein EV126DRAFT_53128 [Verticillium dahliae]EGY18028.1 hypothetical protein VDAG_08362 [Verticillium dahliae VdLs.17]